MSIEDRIGLGFTFEFDDGGEEPIVVSIVDPGMSESSSKATAPTSKLGDVNDTFLGGSVDPGEISFTIAFNPASEVYAALEDWYQSVNQAATRACAIRWPAQGEYSGAEPEGSSSGDGILTSLGRTINRNELVSCEITIKKTGAWPMVDVDEE